MIDLLKKEKKHKWTVDNTTGEILTIQETISKLKEEILFFVNHL